MYELPTADDYLHGWQRECNWETWESNKFQGSKVITMQLSSVFHDLDPELARCKSARTEHGHFGQAHAHTSAV